MMTVRSKGRGVRITKAYEGIMHENANLIHGLEGLLGDLINAGINHFFPSFKGRITLAQQDYDKYYITYLFPTLLNGEGNAMIAILDIRARNASFRSPDHLYASELSYGEEFVAILKSEPIILLANILKQAGWKLESI